MATKSDFARAALLRERLLSALRAAPAPMSAAELCGMSGIVEMYHKQMLSQKVSMQLSNMVKGKLVDRVGRGQYAASKQKSAAALPDTGWESQKKQPLQHLQLEVHKRDRMVTFVFEGLQISVKVLP